MSCLREEQLRSNVKSNESEVIDGHRLDEENLDMDLKPPFDDAETHADPLQEQVSVWSNFAWKFKDEDTLLQDEKLVEVILRPARGRGKRGRPFTTNANFLSSSGLVWTLERDVPAGPQDEIVLMRQQACGKGPARSVTNAVDSWMLLFDDDMLRILLRLVNEQIRKRRTRSYVERATDLTELRSWLGLSYLCGVFRNAQHNGPLEELWTVELGNAIFRATMSLARFEFLTACLCGLHESSWKDAQRLWQKLLINCRSYYGPSCWICVDEIRSLTNAPVMMSCDAMTHYMTNALLDKQQLAPNIALMQLVCDYKTTGRNITLGTPYASLSHCDQLLKSNLSSICTLQRTAPEYPPNWSDGTLIRGASKLTQQCGGALLTCGLSHHVNAMKVHKLTSDACRDFHELSSRYSCAFASPSRHADPFIELLHLMLNIASFNAWILLRMSPKGDANIEQRDFQRQLGLFLTQQRLQRRLHRRSTTTTLVKRLQICEILGQPTQRLLHEASFSARQANGLGIISLAQAAVPEGITLVSRYGDKHRRCKPCARNKRETKARSRCQQCQAHRCGNHLISRCHECMGLTAPQLPLPLPMDKDS
ncbi:hypothetical protein KR222_005005 [Zaprionus bogoriensis]|nr:hypothetical protein KR222_005005 [Zaprionus bogoriensis]